MTAYFDTCGASMATSAAEKDTLAAGEFPAVNSAISCAAIAGGSYHIGVAANMASSVNQRDRLHVTASVVVSEAFVCTALSRQRIHEKPVPAKAASSVTQKETLNARSKCAASMASSVKEQDTLTAHALPKASAASSVAVKSTAHTFPAVGASSAASIAGHSRHRAKEHATASMASSVAVTSQTGQNAHVGASMAVHVTQKETLTAHELTGASMAMFGSDSTAVSPSLDGNLIACCRYWCLNTFTEIASKSTGQKIVEALPPTSAQVKDADFPCIVLVAGEPTPFEQAVLDIGQHVQVDFVYYVRTFTDGATDTAQYIRNRLSALRANLMTDFHLTQANGSYLTQDTTVVADPMQKTTAYQNLFAGDNMNVSSMVLSMRFTLVTSASGV